jgi:hypothetical protein
MGGGTEYFGVAHLPERCLQLPVAFDKDDHGRGGTEVLEHRVCETAKGTDDHVVTNSLVDLHHVTVDPLSPYVFGNPGRH